MDYDFAGLQPTLIDAVARLRSAFERSGIQYALIGGLAVGSRSRPRSTKDVDILLAVPQIKLPGLLEDLITQGFTIDVRSVIEGFVQHHITMFEYRGVRIDWLKPAVAAYQHILDQASEALVFGQPVRVATAEGLIVLKLTASRPQDIADIAALLASNRGRLDLAWIEQEWCTLFELEDPRWQRFQEAVKEYYEHSSNS
jgi:hypothetical protein